MSLDPTLLPALTALAHRAGEAILKVYHSDDLGVQTKSDDSPVTAADLAAHHVLAAGLPGLLDIPVLSEEGGIPDFETRRHWDRYWLVDPLDGTKEFVKRSGEFTVNIALIEDGRPILGVVHLPVTGATYTGIVGQGAWRDGAPIQVAAAPDPPGSRPLLVVASKSHMSPETEAYIAALGPHDLVQAGSSLKICRVAEGTADVYPRLGPTMEWDTAAAHAVLDAAGGSMVDVDGSPLRYNKPDLLNPYFIAQGGRVGGSSGSNVLDHHR